MLWKYSYSTKFFLFLTSPSQKADQVWLPKIDLFNADFPQIQKKPATVTVVKENDPLDDDPSLAVHGQYCYFCF